MKLLALGATGGIGLEIVRQALEQSHAVTVFVRSTARLGAWLERINTFRRNLLNVDELVQVVGGQDAILSAFGPRVPISKADSDLLQRFGVALTGAMIYAGVRRVVVVSTAFLFEDSIIPPAYLFGRLFFKDLVADASRMEEAFVKSKLDWIIVRPPQLTDKPRTGQYRVQEGHLPRFGFNISRADVADFMIKSATNGGALRTIVEVTN